MIMTWDSLKWFLKDYFILKISTHSRRNGEWGWRHGNRPSSFVLSPRIQAGWLSSTKTPADTSLASCASGTVETLPLWWAGEETVFGTLDLTIAQNNEILLETAFKGLKSFAADRLKLVGRKQVTLALHALSKGVTTPGPGGNWEHLRRSRFVAILHSIV